MRTSLPVATWRIHSEYCPSSARTMYATYLPSGEMAARCTRPDEVSGRIVIVSNATGPALPPRPFCH